MRPPAAGGVEAALKSRGTGLTLLSAATNAKAGGDLGGYASRFGLLLMALVGLGAVLLIYRTFADKVRERTKEIAVLCSICWTLREIRRQFALEALGLWRPFGCRLGVSLPSLRSAGCELRIARPPSG